MIGFSSMDHRQILQFAHALHIHCNNTLFTMQWTPSSKFSTTRRLLYSKAFASRLKHLYSYLMIQITFFFTRVRFLIESTLRLLRVKLIHSLLFWKYTKRRDIYYLSCLLHVLLSHFINIKLTDDVTCRSFLLNEYLSLFMSSNEISRFWICSAMSFTLISSLDNIHFQIPVPNRRWIIL